MDNLFLRKNQLDPDWDDNQQIDKTEALTEMNERFKMMGWQSYGEADLNKVITVQDNESLNDQFAREIIQGQMVKMTLISADQAELMEKHFPEIAGKAKSQMKTLEEQSKVSGMEKVKNDFLGKKRKEAQAKLKEIEDQRKEYNAKLIESERAHFAELSRTDTDEINQRKNELTEKIANEKDAEKKALYETYLSKLSAAPVMGSSERDLNYKLSNGSEYEFRNSYLMEGIKKKIPVFQKGDKISRDISRFAIPLEIHTRDTSVMFGVDENGLTAEEREFNYDQKVDYTVRLADDINVVLKGEHLKTANKDADPAPINQKESAKRVITALDSRVDQIRKFENLCQDLFVENPSIHKVAASTIDIKAAYSMLQVSEIVSSGLLKSEVFNKLEEEDRIKVGQIYVYLRSMREYTQHLDTWNMNYQSWVNNPAGEQPKLGESFDSISKRYVYDMSSKLAKI